MKKLWIILLLLMCITAKIFAQNSQDKVFHLNKLSKQDTLLSGWKFHAGDNQQWAKPGIDDSKWQPIDPAQDITGFKQLKDAGTGWIRLHIKADSDIARQQLAARVFQFSASEIYLNGKLIKKYGSINPDPSKTVAWSPVEDLFSLKLQPGIDQVIAVRLAYQSGIPYVSALAIPLPAFSMYVNNDRSARINYHNYKHYVEYASVFIASLAGVFLIISLIYFVYFMFDHHQKVNLYYFIFSVLLCLVCITSIGYYNNIEHVSNQMWLSFSFAIIFVISFLFLVLTIYSLFSYRSRIAFKILALIGILVIGYLLIDDLWGYVLCSNGFIMLCLLEGGRVSIVAIKQKKKDARIILAGIISGVVFNIWTAFLDQQTIYAQLIGCLALLGFPLGMAFYLGLQNAFTNKKLKLTLVEVQALSQEKQQILATQNERLEKQVAERTEELNLSLIHLKSTQAQLIQSEKMASLGQLTAGIAHEIQNPLNFVNNFSDVNKELLTEMKDEIDKGNTGEVKSIANDIIDNEEKINMHGKRADAIVKAMLEHSRVSTGSRELTDINALADEYLRLSYYGFKAKNKLFNAELVTRFDPALPKVNVVPQDIGRGLLNLFNNAFYAVLQKQKAAGEGYSPEVKTTTYLENASVVIKVKDNGIGIPDSIKDKIMQPFFTTKPTGEGTGLGLSLTYDMVVKGHGGSIDLTSNENQGAEFIIKLPIS